MSWKWKIFKNLYVYPSRKAYIFTRIFLKIFLLSYCLIVWRWLRININCLQIIQITKCRENICSNLAYFTHIWSISNIIGHKKPLKFNLFSFSSSDLIDYPKLFLAILIWSSYKLTTLVKQNSNCNAVFSWKMLQKVFILFHVFLV